MSFPKLFIFCIVKTSVAIFLSLILISSDVDGFLSLQSDEDLALKQQLELYVERVQDSDPGLQKMALESMR